METVCLVSAKRKMQSKYENVQFKEKTTTESERETENSRNYCVFQ